MKHILFILSVMISSALFSQSTANLDAKNGFRHFKLGSSPSQIKNIVKNEKQFSKNPNVTSYIYTRNDIQYVADVKVDEITLYFFKNQLMGIQVEFGNFENRTDFTYSDYYYVLKYFEQVYGEDWLNPRNSDGATINGAIWDGKKIRLELLRKDYSKNHINPQDYGFISGYISVFDKDLDRKMYESNF